MEGSQQQPKQQKEKAKEPAAKKGEDESSAPLELNPLPEFIQSRITLYDQIKQKRANELQAKPKGEIKITLRDGKVVPGVAWETTPMAVAKGISKQFAEKVVVAKVNSEAWDLNRVLEADCRVEFLDVNDAEGQAVFWHSSAHILGEACERHYGCLLEHGPPTDDGFFYDMRMAKKEETVSEKDFPVLEKLCKQIVKENQEFERLEMTKEELLEMFKYNDMKLHFIREKIPDGSSSTVYRCGPLIDLCLGPHIPNTNRVKAYTVYRNASSYWLGKAENEVLQRVYGISFTENKLLTEWLQWREEAKKRDHRVVGRNQELFFFHELSPGSCFFLPHGARVYNTLISFIRSEYVKRGFSEVITPNMYNVKLWERSGHWQNYHENMFSFDVENEKFALKPMNCPGHCLMFGLRTRSHRELPLRMADFGVLHRNELSGALTGLTRVRRFQQDDAHIFCAPEQINSEIEGALDFLKHVYGIFGFSLTMALSTRPEKYLGEIEVWDKAEKQLEEALNKSGFEWKLNPGDGAFYGPKIDITISDAMRRRHQCATIQLDFQLPIRFELSFQRADGTEVRPVMIHRAVLGSVERMIAILTESFGGKWPFWLSPRQISVVPVAPTYYNYGKKIRDTFVDAGFFADLDDSGDTMNKKIRNAQLENYNFIFVVGEKEEESQSVNIRTRDNVVHGTLSIDETILKLQKLARSRNKVDEF